MPTNDQPQVITVLGASECGDRDEAAEGVARLSRPDGDGLLIFCTECSRREFGD